MSYLQSLAILIISMLFSLVANKAAGRPELAHVRGSLTYDEATSLPPGSEVTAELVDVSRPGASERTIATAVIRAAERGTLGFEFTYDRDQVDPRAKLAIRGRISSGGRDLYATRAPVRIDICTSQPIEVALQGVRA